MNLSEKTKTIKTREDLAAFIRELSSDCRRNPGAWQNADLPSFLEALSAWTDDMDGYYQNQGQPVPEKPEWRTLADMLLAAKIYE